MVCECRDKVFVRHWGNEAYNLTGECFDSFGGASEWSEAATPSAATSSAPASNTAGLPSSPAPPPKGRSAQARGNSRAAPLARSTPARPLSAPGNLPFAPSHLLLPPRPPAYKKSGWRWQKRDGEGSDRGRFSAA